MPRLVVYNIAYGQGIRGKKSDYFKFWKRLFPAQSALTNITTALCQFKPDILTLIELDKGNLRINNQLGVAQKKLHLSFSDARVKYNGAGFTLPLPHLPILKRQSNGVASAYKIVEQKTHAFSKGFKRIVCQYTLRIGQTQCTLLIVHLALGEKTRREQIEELARVCRAIHGPLIVAGDFNASIDELSELLRTRTLTNAVSGPTFPAHAPNKQLDYVLFSREITIRSAKIISNLPYSDHLPIFIDFEVE